MSNSFDAFEIDECESNSCGAAVFEDADVALLAVMEFLKQVSQSLLTKFPDVQRWDQTDDVFQQSALRLYRALQETAPESRRHLENLAAVQVRRTLIDLGRKYAASTTMNPHRWTPLHADQSFGGVSDAEASEESDPQGLIEWVELHEQIERLPEDAKEVFQLIWYRGLHKEDVAELLGIELRTVQRRWRAAREVLAGRLGDLPR